jgi:hypothetical protein
MRLACEASYQTAMRLKKFVSDGVRRFADPFRGRMRVVLGVAAASFILAAPALAATPASPSAGLRGVLTAGGYRYEGSWYEAGAPAYLATRKADKRIRLATLIPGSKGDQLDDPGFRSWLGRVWTQRLGIPTRIMRTHFWHLYLVIDARVGA